MTALHVLDIMVPRLRVYGDTLIPVEGRVMHQCYMGSNEETEEMRDRFYHMVSPEDLDVFLDLYGPISCSLGSYWDYIETARRVSMMIHACLQDRLVDVAERPELEIFTVGQWKLTPKSSDFMSRSTKPVYRRRCHSLLSMMISDEIEEKSLAR